MDDDDKVDFTEALTAGLAAAEGAARALEEVRSVVREAAQSVRSVTGGKLSLYLDATSVEKLNAWTNSFMKNLGLEQRPYIVNLHAIFVGHLIKYPDGTSKIERSERVCLVRLGEQTYPLIIEWEDSNSVCNDVHALRTALSKMLRDARVARIFQELLSTYTSELPQDKQITDGRPPDNYMSLIADAKRSGAAQNVTILGNSTKGLQPHIKGTVSIGILFDTYFELRIPIVDLVGIPICKIPYTDIDWATIDPPGQLNLRLKSTITWNGNELSAE